MHASSAGWKCERLIQSGRSGLFVRCVIGGFNDRSLGARGLHGESRKPSDECLPADWSGFVRSWSPSFSPPDSREHGRSKHNPASVQPTNPRHHRHRNPSIMISRTYGAPNSVAKSRLLPSIWQQGRRPANRVSRIADVTTLLRADIMPTQGTATVIYFYNSQ